MSYRSALIKLTAFAFITVLMTAFLARTVQGYQDENAHTYEALFVDATRLGAGDEVRLAGVTVGRVEEISLTTDAQARVRFTVDSTVKLTTATTATLRFRNLIGDRYISLNVPSGDAAKLAPGGTLPAAQTRPALDLTAVFNGFRPLFAGLDSESINSLALSLVRALQGEGGTIASLLSSTGSLGHAIAERDATISALVRDLTTVLGTINTESAPFNRLVTHLRDLSSGLADDRTLIVNALDGIDNLAIATNSLLARARPGLKGTIDGLATTTHKLKAGQDTLVEKLNLLPVKLNAVLRAAQYGSWFQFYNCGIGVEIDLLGDAPPLATPPHPPTTEICGA